jgi:hypothetical protein
VVTARLLAAALLPTGRVVDDEQRFGEVDDHRGRGIRDRLEIDEVAGAGAEPGHAHPRQPAGPQWGRDVPHGRCITSRPGG